MDGKTFYETCLMQATDIVSQVQPTQLDDKTPDDEWSVRDLLNHMLNEVVWVPDMVSGKTVDEVGDKYEGDLVGSDVQSSWAQAANQARDAAHNADLAATAHLSYADVPVDDYLQMTGGDVLVHAWDLAKAIGVDITFNEQVAEQMWQGIKDLDTSGSDVYKPALPVSDEASAQEKILAKFGRNINWQP